VWTFDRRLLYVTAFKRHDTKLLGIICRFVLVCAAIVGFRYIHSDTRYSECRDVSDTTTHGVRGLWVIDLRIGSSHLCCTL